MWGLTLKDFLIMKWYIGVAGFLFGAMTLWLMRGLEGSPFGLSAVWLLIWFVLTRALFAYDGHGRSEAIVNSLPLSRRDIVAGRHLASTILLNYTFFIVLVWCGVVKVLGGNFPFTIHWAHVTAGGLISAGIATVILFPVLFKVDFAKARWITLFVIFLFIMPLYNASPNWHSMQTQPWLEAFFGIPDAMVLGAAILVFAALTLLSILISTRLYQTREF